MQNFSLMEGWVFCRRLDGGPRLDVDEDDDEEEDDAEGGERDGEGLLLVLHELALPLLLVPGALLLLAALQLPHLDAAVFCVFLGGGNHERFVSGKQKSACCKSGK